MFEKHEVVASILHGHDCARPLPPAALAFLNALTATVEYPISQHPGRPNVHEGQPARSAGSSPRPAP
jgi:hypothetical protein